MAAHVFVEDVGAPAVEVGPADFRHLARVLRLRRGEVVSVSDGAGWSRLCRWTGEPRLEPTDATVFERRPEPEIAVAFALTKGARPEWAVQKLTEAGVDRVVLMTTAHCVARWAPADVPRRLGRLREVARQAAMQSRRSWLPVVEGPLAFSELVRAGPAGVALAVPEGRALSLAAPMVLVGPEGGWAAEELDAVRAHVALGPHILRAETAALAAGVLLVALRAGLVSEVPASPDPRSSD